MNIYKQVRDSNSLYLIQEKSTDVLDIKNHEKVFIEHVSPRIIISLKKEPTIIDLNFKQFNVETDDCGCEYYHNCDDEDCIGNYQCDDYCECGDDDNCIYGCLDCHDCYRLKCFDITTCDSYHECDVTCTCKCQFNYIDNKIIIKSDPRLATITMRKKGYIPSSPQPNIYNCKKNILGSPFIYKNLLHKTDLSHYKTHDFYKMQQIKINPFIISKSDTIIEHFDILFDNNDNSDYKYICENVLRTYTLRKLSKILDNSNNSNDIYFKIICVFIYFRTFSNRQICNACFKTTSSKNMLFVLLGKFSDTQNFTKSRITYSKLDADIYRQCLVYKNVINDLLLEYT